MGRPTTKGMNAAVAVAVAVAVAQESCEQNHSGKGALQHDNHSVAMYVPGVCSQVMTCERMFARQDRVGVELYIHAWLVGVGASASRAATKTRLRLDGR